MALVQIDWRPDRPALRRFGVAMIVGFGLIGAVVRWGFDEPGASLWLWGLGAAAGALGLSGTRAALVVYLPWMGIAFVVGNVVSRVLLVGVWLFVVTPTALLGRLLGRDRLALKRPPTTMWVDLPPPPPPESYRRQF